VREKGGPSEGGSRGPRGARVKKATDFTPNPKKQTQPGGEGGLGTQNRCKKIRLSSSRAISSLFWWGGGGRFSALSFGAHLTVSSFCRYLLLQRTWEGKLAIDVKSKRVSSRPVRVGGLGGSFPWTGRRECVLLP